MRLTRPRRSVDNPTAGERREIQRRIELLPLMRRDAPGTLDWAALAGRLAEQLSETTRRLAASPALSEADAEQVTRAAVVLGDYQTASAADDGCT